MGKFIDEVGNRYGRWLVLARAENDKHGKAQWMCRCDCGTEGVVLGESLRNGNTKSCGCYKRERTSESNKNRIVSAETRKKLSEAKKGQVAWNKGKGHSAETCKKMSESHIGLQAGEKNPSWNPNLTDEERITKRNYPEYHEWRTAVFERDSFTCQICGQRGGKLQAHHVESYRDNPDLRTTISNGITLCKKCHRDFHHQYGNDCTKKQLNEFMR